MSSLYYDQSDDEYNPPATNARPAAYDALDPANISDSDALGLAALMENELASVVRNTIDKFVSVKLRVLKEHEVVCDDKDVMYQTKIRKMQNIIDTLREELVASQQTVAGLGEEKLRIGESRAMKHCKDMLMRGAGPSLLSCVRLWKQYTAEKKVERKTDKIAAKWSRKNCLVKSLQTWSRSVALSKRERDDEMSNAKLETVTREIITRYEAELEKHRMGLKDAHVEIARGHVQRQQLEEKMRRTFLKGMTAMNMEALELFNAAATKDASFMGDSPDRD
jgi:centrosomal protein POC5